MPDGATLIRPTGRTVGRIRRSRRHPAKISHASPTPRRSSAALKSIENSHILYG
ncbi:hypothetical protein AF349_10345 [Salmonella enterica subsp. enterica serovar Typhimurium]|nr:hypothetical protein AF349_10345 [Salmonella enterica subsp. enterica serovar Typhimurium]